MRAIITDRYPGLVHMEVRFLSCTVDALANGTMQSQMVHSEAAIFCREVLHATLLDVSLLLCFNQWQRFDSHGQLHYSRYDQYSCRRTILDHYYPFGLQYRQVQRIQSQ